jgi:hypothetical protein
MMLKCIKRLGEKPYLLVSAGLFWGFLKGYLQNLPQVDDKELIRACQEAVQGTASSSTKPLDIVDLIGSYSP